MNCIQLQDYNIVFDNNFEELKSFLAINQYTKKIVLVDENTKQYCLPILEKNISIDVIIEIKSVEKISNVHLKQLLTYIRVTDLRLGLLINFNEALIKNGIKRVAHGLY